MRRRVGIAAVLIVGVVVAVAIAEIGLRATVRRAVTTGTHRYMMSDPVLHHRAPPGASVSVSGVPFSTNSLGLREREYVSPKPARVVRFLMLGDSFTEGAGLRLDWGR